MICVWCVYMCACVYMYVMCVVCMYVWCVWCVYICVCVCVCVCGMCPCLVTSQHLETTPLYRHGMVNFQ